MKKIVEGDGNKINGDSSSSRSVQNGEAQHMNFRSPSSRTSDLLHPALQTCDGNSDGDGNHNQQLQVMKTVTATVEGDENGNNGDFFFSRFRSVQNNDASA
ncbi:hypothetical protein F2Q70_00002957 [Brassica cretica]|uniref:Uncharacterized protein n=1 Tax=Brassica cretica TaxID=69181 RepID=A0A8S9IKZ0_BRACR|nr:hypothetical protein F2Q70_00002957 [Brassica cretica]KAF3568287.1 hypothetical protein DY000_02014628 [Brassica cretica]